MLYDDPDLYDTLQPASAAQVSYYLNLARERAGAVLALACGSGQVAVPIAAAGLPVTGLDLSSAMLKVASRRAAAANAQVELIFPQELRVLLASNGLQLTRRDGDYSGTPFASAAPTQVCQCRVA